MHPLHMQAGPSKSMNWYDANGNGSTAPAGRRGADGDAMNGNAVMLDAGKILTVGGSPSYVNSVATAHANLVSADALLFTADARAYLRLQHSYIRHLIRLYDCILKLPFLTCLKSYCLPTQHVVFPSNGSSNCA